MSKRKWAGVIVVIMASMLCYTAKAQESTVPSPAIDLKTAVEMALAKNNSLKADSMNIVAAGYQAEIARAALRPQANYLNKFEYNPEIPTQMLPGKVLGQPNTDFVPVEFGTSYNMGSSMEITQGLFRRNTRYRVEQAELEKTIARTRHTMSKEELVFAVVNSFFGLQAASERIRTTNKDYQNLLEITKVAKAQVDNAVLKRIDYESLLINTANKEAQLKKLRSDYTDQLTYFKYLLGVSPIELLVIDENISDVTDTAYYQGNQFSKREDLKLYRQLIHSKEIEMKAIHADRLPQLSSYFKFNYQAQFNEAEKAFNNDYWFRSSTIGLSVSIPIFDGNRRRNKMKVAQTQLQQLRFNMENQKLFAATEQVQAWEGLNNDRAQYSITRQNLALAENVFSTRRALYTEGVSSLIELLDAEKELTESRNLYIQALINVKTSLVNIHKANGTLLTDFILSLN